MAKRLPFEGIALLILIIALFFLIPGQVESQAVLNEFEEARILVAALLGANYVMLVDVTSTPNSYLVGERHPGEAMELHAGETWGAALKKATDDHEHLNVHYSDGAAATQ